MTVARIETEDGRVVCERCVLADSFWLRLRGLIGRRELPAGEGMLFPRTGSVHMLFMRIPLDVVFCDRDLRVVRVVADLRPWRLAGARRAKNALELRAGEAERRGLAVGDRLRVVA